MRLFACIISNTDDRDLASLAEQFSAKIELIEGGILFDVSGLEKLIGDQVKIAQSIAESLRKNNIKGNIAVSKDPDTAVLFAANIEGVTTDADTDVKTMPVGALRLEADIRNVFENLGLTNIDQLKKIPENDLISRYGQDFRSVIDLINREGKRTLTPNIKQKRIEWSFELEHSVRELERLVFILASGVSEVLNETSHQSLSTEHMTVEFGLENRETAVYEIKVSFPTVRKGFWRKIIDHRISQDLPQHAIRSIRLICRYTKPRSAQFGLYTATRPEPESLHLTVNKIKKLVGEENVGVPVLVDQRQDKPFLIDSQTEPQGIEKPEAGEIKPNIAFSYYEPPLPAFVWIEKRKLMYLKTRDFEGKVKEHGGIWRASSHWWAGFWSTEEWDVEVEGHGVFRLSRKGREWFVTGEYD